MSLQPEPIEAVPEQTMRIARAAFPKGSTYMRMRDELGIWFDDKEFSSLFSHTGQPALTPWRLALVTVMQFAENLTDRQTADAVRARIDWKYALGLEMEDGGFHYSVLSEFRSRLIEGSVESILLDSMLSVLKEKKLVKAGGKQRTDSTHILTAVRKLNRLELIGETLHHALNSLAEIVPDWVQRNVPPEWYKRYGLRFENTRLPNDASERNALAVVIGNDGRFLLEKLNATPNFEVIYYMSAIETLRIVWLQQFYFDGKEAHWRSRRKHGMAAAANTLISPYDLDARYGQKRNNKWMGYKAHLTETCDAKLPHVITNVVTTSADIPDNHLVEHIHSSLGNQQLRPKIHLVDAGYPDGENLVTSAGDGVDLFGPVRPNNSWQARDLLAYDASQFVIEWDAGTAICPEGVKSHRLKRDIDISGRDIVRFMFSEKDCGTCQSKARCTNTKARQMTVLKQEQHEALQQARKRQTTVAF